MVAGSSPVRTAIIGEMAERFIALVLKTKDLHGSVGFESLSHRKYGDISLIA